MFDSPPPWYLAHPALLTAGLSGASARTADAIYIHDVYLPQPAQLTSFSIQHGGISAGHLDLGIYDTSGKLLAHTGITSCAGLANSEQTINLASPLPLSAGRYSLAIWVDSGTDTYFSVAGMSQAFGNLQNTNNTTANGLADFSTLGGTKAGSVFLPFLGHLAGTGF